MVECRAHGIFNNALCIGGCKFIFGLALELGVSYEYGQ